MTAYIASLILALILIVNTNTLYRLIQNTAKEKERYAHERAMLLMVFIAMFTVMLSVAGLTMYVLSENTLWTYMLDANPELSYVPRLLTTLLGSVLIYSMMFRKHCKDFI